MNKFGKSSKKKLDSCHQDLSKIFQLAIKISKVDFGISEGHRSVEKQLQYFNEGKSKIDGISKKGKHNLTPSEAGDTYIYHPDYATRRKLAYNREHFCYIAGVIDAAAFILLEKEEITHTIRWGANWDSDGIIALDQSFDDYPHFELKSL